MTLEAGKDIPAPRGILFTFKGLYSGNGQLETFKVSPIYSAAGLGVSAPVISLLGA